jgi:lipopolysaccharide export system protein LptC
VSQQADQIRDRRKAFALPGSTLDKTIKLLAVGLPALVGAVAAAMLIAPLSPRGEVSFLLDRNKVATAEDRLRVDEAMYRGRDDHGRRLLADRG